NKMLLYQMGSSTKEISTSLGVEFKGSTDLVGGIIFTLDDQIVYQEEIPYDPEHPNKLEFVFANSQTKFSKFTPDSAIFYGEKEEIDGKLYYLIMERR